MFIEHLDQWSLLGAEVPTARGPGLGAAPTLTLMQGGGKKGAQCWLHPQRLLEGVSCEAGS